MATQQPEPTTNALDMSIIDIDNAIKHQLFYLALVGTLTLIDMCAALESQDGTTSRPKFEAWYSANLSVHYPWLASADCYGLRCGLVHQGISKTDARGHTSQWHRALFVLPGAMVMKNCASKSHSGETAYITGLQEFCADVVDRVKKWLAANQANPTIQANLSKLMHLYPQGLAPHIVGAPLLG